MQEIRNAFLEVLTTYRPEFLVVEHYAPWAGSMGGNSWKTALGYQIGICEGLAFGIPVLIRRPYDLKRAVLGRNAGSKEDVQAALPGLVAGLPELLARSNKGDREHLADAVGHAYLGLDHLLKGEIHMAAKKKKSSKKPVVKEQEAERDTSVLSLAEGDQPSDVLEDEPVVDAEPARKRRKRRTKKEMEAAKAEAPSADPEFRQRPGSGGASEGTLVDVGPDVAPPPPPQPKAKANIELVPELHDMLSLAVPATEAVLAGFAEVFGKSLETDSSVGVGDVLVDIFLAGVEVVAGRDTSIPAPPPTVAPVVGAESEVVDDTYDPDFDDAFEAFSLAGVA